MYRYVRVELLLSCRVAGEAGRYMPVRIVFWGPGFKRNVMLVFCLSVS